MITISQTDISKVLIGKLNENDIKLTNYLTTMQYEKNKLMLHMLTKKYCNFCSQEACNLISIPEMNIFTKLMIIGDIPTELDGKTRTNTFSPGSRILNVALSKLGINMNNVYYTNIAKCPNVNLDEAFGCTSKYLLREIDLVKPMLVVTLGENSAKILRSFLMNEKEYETFDLNENRLKAFNVEFNGNKFILIHAIDPNTLVDKVGAIYNKYKMDFWTDIKTSVDLYNKLISDHKKVS